MQTYTPKQLQSAFDAGGIRRVTITGQGARFYIQITSRNGDGVLTKARSPDPRSFTNPMQAFTELRRLGIRKGEFDTTQWTPEQREAPKRPDRARAMSELHAMAEHGRWARERIAQAQAEAADTETKWVDNATVEADANAQIARIEGRLKNSG